MKNSHDDDDDSNDGVNNLLVCKKEFKKEIAIGPEKKTMFDFIFKLTNFLCTFNPWGGRFPSRPKLST